VEIGWWTEREDALKEHRRWSPACSLVKGLRVGNIPILSNNQPDKSSQQPTRSHEVCGSHYELRPNSFLNAVSTINCTSCFHMFVSYYSALIFNVFLQLQVPELLRKR